MLDATGVGFLDASQMRVDESRGRATTPGTWPGERPLATRSRADCVRPVPCTLDTGRRDPRAGSALNPAPGRTRFATASPISSASVETTSKYTSALWLWLVHGLWALTGRPPPETANNLSLVCAGITVGLTAWATMRAQLSEALAPYRGTKGRYECCESSSFLLKVSAAASATRRACKKDTNQLVCIQHKTPPQAKTRHGGGFLLVQRWEGSQPIPPAISRSASAR